MSTYQLIQNVTTVQTAAPNLIKPSNPMSIVPQNVAVEATLYGQGSCSATVQLVATNDGQNIINLGSIVLNPSAANVTPGAIGTVIVAPYNQFGAYVSVISGTSASANVVLSA